MKSRALFAPQPTRGRLSALKLKLWLIAGVCAWTVAACAWRSHHIEIATPTAPGKLALVLPFTAKETPRLKATLDAWASTGAPCSRPLGQRLDLVFLHNRDEATLRADEFLRDVASSGLLASHRRCFGRVDLLHASLSGVHDEYPAGPSNMFFGIFSAPGFRQFRSTYQFMFWMEWDVQPVKPHWLDCLLREAAIPDFWVRGSMVQANRDIALDSTQWDWIAHINGNALYRLDDPAFADFLQVVADYEPPDHFWKPFDVSMWRVLHAFPYTWPLYERYSGKFQHARFIQHYHFDAPQGAAVDAMRAPETFFVHGANGSAGALKFEEKLSNAERVRSVVWDDAVSDSRRVSVLIQHCGAEATLATVESVQRHMGGAMEFVVLVAADEFSQAREHPGFDQAKVAVVPAAAEFENGCFQEMYSHFMADTYCRGDFIFHVGCNSQVTRKILNRDLFWRGKPVINVDPIPTSSAALWLAGTSQALGHEVTQGLAQGTRPLVPRALFASARSRLQTRLGVDLAAFVRTKLAVTETRLCMAEQELPNDARTSLFSVNHYLTSYAWMYEHDSIAWVSTDPAEEGGQRLPGPLIPDYMTASPSGAG